MRCEGWSSRKLGFNITGPFRFGKFGTSNLGLIWGKLSFVGTSKLVRGRSKKKTFYLLVILQIVFLSFHFLNVVMPF